MKVANQYEMKKFRREHNKRACKKNHLPLKSIVGLHSIIDFATTNRIQRTQQTDCEERKAQWKKLFEFNNFGSKLRALLLEMVFIYLKN